MTDKTYHGRRHSKLVRVVTRGAVVLVAMAAIAGVSMFYAGKTLQGAALSQISELTGTTISTDSVNMSLFGSVLITGLDVKSNGCDESNSVLQADAVYARFSVLSLLCVY